MVSETPLVIESVEEVTAELVEAFARLLPQLSSSPPPDAAALRAIVAQQDSSLLIARNEDGTIVGTLMLFIGVTPSGRKAIIEDVIVDELARGRGAATSMVEYALDIARAMGCPWVQLTSRPMREAANRLYQRLGFVQRESNLYRMTFNPH